MTPEVLFVLAVLGVTIALFASDRFRLDLVALLALLTLLLGGALTVEEALAGFADPTVIMIAGLFVVGGAILRTGLADTLGRHLQRVAGGGPRRLVLVLMLATAGLSAFLSSTGTVAVMLPVAVSMARRARVPVGRLLIPLAYAALFGGMLTLIATPPNIIVSNQLAQFGYEALGFFDFTLPGLVMLGLGVAYVLLFGPLLLPDREAGRRRPVVPTVEGLWQRYGLEGSLFELAVPAASPLVGSTIADAGLRTRYGVTVLTVVSEAARGTRARRAVTTVPVRAGDRLTVQGERAAVAQLAEAEGLELLPGRVGLPEPLLLAELLIPPGSALPGRSPVEARLRDQHGVTVLAVSRGGQLLPGPAARQRLQAGDGLLVMADAKTLVGLRAEREQLVLVTLPEEVEGQLYDTRRAPLVGAIMLGMLLLMTLGLVANVTAVLIAAVALVATRCLGMEDAYRSINWESVVLIAAVLPFSTALAGSGALDLLVDGLLSALGGAGPRLVLLALVALTSLLGQLISNTATAVLVAPIAIRVAAELGVPPHGLALGVAIASSAAFSTPVASPVNLLVVNPGGYRFGDFLRVGLPLQVIVAAAAAVVLPLLFPFD